VAAFTTQHVTYSTSCGSSAYKSKLGKHTQVTYSNKT